MNKLDFLLSKINGTKELNFGTIFSQSIELFKKTWVQGFVMLLLTTLLMLPFYFLMYVPLLAMGLSDPDVLGANGDFNFILFVPFGLMALVFIFFAMIISFALKSAFFRICKMKDFDEVASDDYLYFLKKPYLSKTIKLSAITMGIGILASLLCFFPLIYVMVPLSLINVVYAFNPDMSTSNIVKVGFALGNKKWLITFGLIIVTGILAQFVGMILCFVGVFITASFVYLPLYFIYKETIGFNNTHIIDKIGVIEE